MTPGQIDRAVELGYLASRITNRGSVLIEASEYGAQPEPRRPPIGRWLFSAIIERDGWTCQLCGVAVSQGGVGAAKLHFDHVIPWSKGGPTTVENLRVTCETCNCSRGNRDESTRQG